MRGTVTAVRETGVATKIVIGGAPVTTEFADEIGADGYAQDAGTAVEVVTPAGIRNAEVTTLPFVN